MQSHKWLPALLALLCVSLSVRAQSDELGLEQAVALALERAPQLRAEDQAVESARAELTSAGRLPDPELVLGVDNLPVQGAEAWSLDRDSMTMRKVGVMQAFPNGRKRASQRQRAQAAVSVAQSQLQQVRQETAQEVANAWIESRAAQSVLEKLQALRPEVQLQSDAARTALASGRGSTLDALTARSAVSELDDRVIEATRQVRSARAQLARWIGEDADRPLAIMPDLRELPLPRETLLASVHRHAPLLAFEARQALAESEIELARAEKRPDWSAELAYGNRGAELSDMVSLEFRVGLPLFSSNRQDPMIRARRAELSRIEAEREQELRTHTSEITAMLVAWDAARQRVDLYERERLPLARERSQAALAAFQSGRAELEQVLASRVAELDAQRSYAELMKELGQAWVFLRYLQPERESP